MHKFWKIVIVAIIIGIIGIIATGCGDTTNAGGNNQGGNGSATNNVQKAQDWFVAQRALIQEAEESLNGAQREEDKTKAWFVRNQCYGQPCDDYWLKSSWYSGKHKAVTAAQTRVNTLIAEHDREAAKSGFPLYGSTNT